MVVYPQLCFLMERVGQGGGLGGDLCGLVMSNFWTNNNAALSNLQSLMESRANQRGESIGSPAS